VSEAILYDAIGTGYARRRRADPGIFASVRSALGDARRIINVGAGAGSYEPPDITVAAVEPSSVMAAQRPDHLVPATLATSEALPFIDDAFDGALAVLTLHHWGDVRRGLEELRRVTDGPIVIVTVDPEIATGWWLAVDYPELASSIADPLPTLTSLRDQLGEIDVRVVPVPARCRDGFLMSCWDRPEMLLDPEARAATSCFTKLDADTVRRFVGRLDADLGSGRWDDRNGTLRTLSEFDAGLRIVIARG
jgi:SAM-dependent methyltransferase